MSILTLSNEVKINVLEVPDDSHSFYIERSFFTDDYLLRYKTKSTDLSINVGDYFIHSERFTGNEEIIGLLKDLKNEDLEDFVESIGSKKPIFNDVIFSLKPRVFYKDYMDERNLFPYKEAKDSFKSFLISNKLNLNKNLLILKHKTNETPIGLISAIFRKDTLDLPNPEKENDN